jgi:hypothetical protein
MKEKSGSEIYKFLCDQSDEFSQEMQNSCCTQGCTFYLRPKLSRLVSPAYFFPT